MKEKTLLVGAGPMAIDYSKVLKAMKISFIVVGRGKKSAKIFEKETGIKVINGGLKKWLKNNEGEISNAIVAVSVEELANTTLNLLDNKIKSILVEKPGGLNSKEIKKIAQKTKLKKAKVYIAYNRRYYTSVIEAQKIIKKDNGVTSFNFEFTEWSHEIVKLKKPKNVLNEWLLANSSHIIDLAFFLGGWPKRISGFTAGKKHLLWHPKASIYAGAGFSQKNVLFTYKANWESAGRWAVEILTLKNKIILKPLEKLQIQKRGTISVEEIKIKDSLDKKFKPGLYLQVKCFIGKNRKNLLPIKEHANNLKIYSKINK